MAAPLFLLAPPRSYTSLMNAMLGQHPQAVGLPELCLFNVEILGQMWIRSSDEMGSDAKTRHGLLRAVAEIFAGEQTMQSVRMAEHWCAARQNHTVALFVNSIEFQADRAVVEPQYAWHDFNINILNFLDSVPPEQQMRVRGEDM